MEIFLTEQCKSLTGSLGRGFGYSIRPYKSKNKVRFFSKRDSKGIVPPDGHWRFILTCAELAHANLHIEDIQVDWLELQTALREANNWIAADAVFRTADRQIKLSYDARDVLNLKTTFSL